MTKGATHKGDYVSSTIKTERLWRGCKKEGNLPEILLHNFPGSSWNPRICQRQRLRRLV
jgi:hypothetical protein